MVMRSHVISNPIRTPNKISPDTLFTPFYSRFESSGHFESAQHYQREIKLPSMDQSLKFFPRQSLKNVDLVKLVHTGPDLRGVFCLSQTLPPGHLQVIVISR